MRVASFNLHAGVDGWGRPTGALEHAARLNADVLVCPELWRGDDGTDFFEILCARLSMKGLFVPPRARRTSHDRAAAGERGNHDSPTSRANTDSTSKNIANSPPAKRRDARRTAHSRPASGA